MTSNEHSDNIDTLNDLIETCKDGEYGFRTSSENVRSVELRQLFTRRADECGQAARDLQSQVANLGGAAEKSGSMSGAAHRGWVAVKATLTGNTDLAILEETERGEDIALESYRDALGKGLPSELRSMVERQLQGVQRNHAEIRMLRDQARNASEGTAR